MNNRFGFSEAWFALNVISADTLVKMEEQFLTTDDKHLEHYRWRAFTEFIRANRPLNSFQALNLYRLGEADSDMSLGVAMMAEVLRLEECQDDLLQLALSSNRAHLIKIANEIKQSKEG